MGGSTTSSLTSSSSTCREIKQSHSTVSSTTNDCSKDNDRPIQPSILDIANSTFSEYSKHGIITDEFTEQMTHQSMDKGFEQYGISYRLFPVIKYPNEVLFPLPQNVFIAQQLIQKCSSDEIDCHSRLGGSKKQNASVCGLNPHNECERSKRKWKDNERNSSTKDDESSQTASNMRSYRMTNELNASGEDNSERTRVSSVRGNESNKHSSSLCILRTDDGNNRLAIKCYSPCQSDHSYISICGHGRNPFRDLGRGKAAINCPPQSKANAMTGTVLVEGRYNSNQRSYLTRYKAVGNTFKLTLNKALKLRTNDSKELGDNGGELWKSGLHMFVRNDNEKVCRMPSNFATVASSLNPFFASMMFPNSVDRYGNNHLGQADSMANVSSPRYLCIPRNGIEAPDSTFPFSQPMSTVPLGEPILPTVETGMLQSIPPQLPSVQYPNGIMDTRISLPQIPGIPRGCIKLPTRSITRSCQPFHMSQTSQAPACSPDTIIIRRKRRRPRHTSQSGQLIGQPTYCWSRQPVPICIKTCQPRIIEQVIPPDKVIYEQVHVGYKTERTIIQPPLQEISMQTKKFMVIDVGSSSNPCNGKCTIMNAEQVVEMAVCEAGINMASAGGGREHGKSALHIKTTSDKDLDFDILQKIFEQSQIMTNGDVTQTTLQSSSTSDS